MSDEEVVAWLESSSAVDFGSKQEPLPPKVIEALRDHLAQYEEDPDL